MSTVRNADFVIEDDKIAVRLGPHGQIASMVDKEIGRDYIAPSGEHPQPLFRIVVVDVRKGQILPGDYQLSSAESEEVTMGRQGAGLKLEFSRIGGKPINVVCRARIGESPGQVAWQIIVTNRSEVAIRAVEFPVVCVKMPLEASGDRDRILVPRHDGYLVGNPELRPWREAGREVDSQRFLYPGEGRDTPRGLSVQLVAYYDTAGGLSIATYDAVGHPKMLGPTRVTAPPGLDFTPVHIAEEEAGRDYECSYETVTSCFQGDWQAAADVYKAWARRQPWCSKTLSDRDDIPGWVKRGAFFFNFRLRNQVGGAAFLDHADELVARWGEVLGIPMVAMMCGWEKTGEWTGPDYFPPFGGDRFRELCSRLKARGVRPFPFGLSGLKLSLRKRIGALSAQPELAVDHSGWEEFFDLWHEHAATQPGGQPIMDSSVGEWDGLHAYACVATPQAWKQLHEATLTLVREYGAQVSQCDQVLGGGTTECYSTAHGHSPGRGRWQLEALRAIYRAIRKDAKKIDPEFVLSQEWQSEYLLQDLDLYHARNYEEPRGIDGVPLFSYLYHEYLPCFGGDWQSFLGDNSGGVYYHAANLVNGNLPSGCPQTMWKEVGNHPPEDADPRTLLMAQNACAVFRAATSYLLFGEMMRTPELDVPGEEVEFVGIDFYSWGKGKRWVPSVPCRAWRSPDDNIAYVMANISSVEQRFHLTITAPGKPGPARLVRSINGQNPRVLENTVELPHTVELRLAPQDALVLEAVFVS